MLYSHKNGLNLNETQLNRLKPRQTDMKKYVLTRSNLKKKRILKNNLLKDLLNTIIEVATDLEIEI